MFGWRRKNDGFEWNEYVRTTIKLRREDRRRKLLEIKASAAERASEAGQVGIGVGRYAIQWLGQRIAVWFPTVQLEAEPLQGTEGGTSPFFSPDGTWVGFVLANQTTVMRVATSGGSPIVVCEAPNAVSGARK